jgi:hypothetical protein
MKLEEFIQIGELLKEQEAKLNQLYKLSVDLIEFSDAYYKIISTCIRSHYGEGGLDWWSWFCWENDYGRGTLTAHDEENNPICFDWESLWKYLEENHKAK